MGWYVLAEYQWSSLCTDKITDTNLNKLNLVEVQRPKLGLDVG